MLALSPPMFVWPLDDLMSDELLQIYFDKEITKTTNSDQSFIHSSPIYDEFAKILSEVDEVDTTLAKKLDHNASERDRRKKVNNMYCSLRSLLPTTIGEQTKKLSIPSTITCALKYIPELQGEVEALVQKKEKFKLEMDQYREKEKLQDDHKIKKQRRSGNNKSSLGVVWVYKLGNEDVVIQLCTDKSSKRNIRISDIFVTLEEEGLLLLSFSCFESFGERVFHNLHLQVQATQTLNLEMLKKQLLSVYEKI